MKTDRSVDLLKKQSAFTDAIALPTPPFEFRIRWAKSYDALFGGVPAEETAIEELVSRSLSQGRVILQAEGGAGKTSILLRLLKSAPEQDLFAVFVDLRRWRPELFEFWESARDSEPQRIQILLETLGLPEDSNEDAMRETPPELRCLLVVDGLNELPVGIGDSLLMTLDAFARRNPRVGVIVTDRLVRRPLEDPRWSLATVAPLDNQEGLMGNAFFRDLVQREGIDSTSSAGVHHAYISQHVNLNEEEFARTTRAALQLYEETKTRSFLMSSLMELAGSGSVQKLLESGIVVQERDLVSFKHHLIHDYLASVAVATNPDGWNKDTFDALTLEASSFDALAMCLEQLPEKGDADRLVRHIYDWNAYGATYALSTSRRRGTAAVTEEMETALLSSLAERRWDVIRATAQQVTDALTLFPSETADRLLDAGSLEDVIAIAGEVAQKAGSTTEWFRIFSIPVGADLDNDVVETITDSDSLIGWTAANVIKRGRLGTSQLAFLLKLVSDQDADPILRWRVVHALGAHPSEETLAVLFDALRDPYQWVRYGAIRSAIECAARSDEFRNAVFDALRSMLPALEEDPRVLSQFGRCVILREPPPGWSELAGPVIENLFAHAPTEKQQDMWRRIAYDLRRSQEDTDSRVA
jgi:hypothetical protein